jgi:hypothetical protein
MATSNNDFDKTNNSGTANGANDAAVGAGSAAGGSAGTGPSADGGAEVVAKKPSWVWKFVKKHPVLTAVFCGLLLAFAVWAWKEIEFSMERKAILKQTELQIEANKDALLKVLVKPIVWSIRSELMRGNRDQVELLMTDLLRGSDLEYLHLVDNDRNVVLSTNKKLEGMPVDDKDVSGVLGTDSTMVFRVKNSTLTTVVAPVMGYDSRLGTLVLGYK